MGGRGGEGVECDGREGRGVECDGRAAILWYLNPNPCYPAMSES